MKGGRSTGVLDRRGLELGRYWRLMDRRGDRTLLLRFLGCRIRVDEWRLGYRPFRC